MKYFLTLIIALSLPCFSGEITNVTLKKDQTFHMDRLLPSQGYKYIIDFEVTKDAIWILEEVSNGEPFEGAHLTKINLNHNHKSEITEGTRQADLQRGYNYLLSMNQSQDQLTVINLDPEHGCQVLAVDHRDSLKTIQALQRCVVTQMRQFSNGNCLVKGERMASEMAEFSGEGADILKTQEFAKYDGFDTFVVDAQFGEITSIKKRFMSRQILDEQGKSGPQAVRGISHIRMGLNKDLAAIFHRKRRGIQIIDSYGEQKAFLEHPGQGMATARKDEYGNPMVINIQADVAVNDRDGYVLVADIVSDYFWLVNFQNKVFAKAKLPFPVYNIKLTQDFVYLFGRDGRFGRYHYPSQVNGERISTPSQDPIEK